jgi:glycine cleavage system H protein
VSDLFMPVSGEILEINEDAGSAPETINSDPYGKGWLIRIRLSDPAQTAKLMKNDAYDAYTASEE